MSINIRFWGVRGSIASPGPQTVETGGNTSCVEVVAGSTRIILDAGTGLRALGQELAAAGPVDATVLFSHVHWDHIQGFPFFAPLFVPGTRLHCVSGANGVPLADTLRRQMSAPNFPVDLRDVPAALSYLEVRDRQRFVVGDAEIQVAKANHPDSVFAYRIELGGASVVYATDTEHYSCVDRRLEALSRDADVLIYDAQYLPAEYSGLAGPSKIGWGHSTYEAVAELARASGVRRLVLFHHDPNRDDAAVGQIERLARERFDSTIAAREGLEIAIAPRACRSRAA